MGQAYEELCRQGAEVIAIVPGTADVAARYRAIGHLPYPVVADPDGTAYARFAVGRWLLGMLRQTAIFVVDREGRIVYRRVVDNPRGVLDLHALLAAVRDVGSNRRE